MEFITNYYRNYTPAPDILTLTICILFFMIMATVYINKTKSFLYLKSMIYFLVIGSIADVLFHIALNHIESVPHIWIYILRSTYHLSLFMIMLLQVLYAKENLQITYHVFNIYFSITIIGYVVLVGYEIISTVYAFGFYIDELNMVHAGFPIFPFGYIFKQVVNDL